jgi:alkylated DNA repair protein (DNA oxidative demethylase)
MSNLDLFGAAELEAQRQEPLGHGAVVLRAFAASRSEALSRAVEDVTRGAPFRQMMTPGGFRMSVAMTNCGKAGWVTDARGYRYDSHDPMTGEYWPPLPAVFSELATGAAAEAGFADFVADACLVNRYEPGARMSLHQDKNEQDLSAPIVSVSLGLPAVFLFGGLRRSDRPQAVPLAHGDVVVWGGPARLKYHGVRPVKDGQHPLLGSCRVNLTFRKAL